MDLKQGVIIVRDGKFGKDRLVPPAVDMVKRLPIYTERMETVSLEKCTEEAYFFPSSHTQAGWSKTGIYYLFRRLLYQCGISHGGRGKGPRVHDLRHTFAVHCLKKWSEQEKDLTVYLPILKTYLGHDSFKETAYYLHLTADVFSHITLKVETCYPGIIPDLEGDGH